MKPGYGLELVETQKLVLTPELRQALAILQMSALELTTFMRQQVTENPLLEMATDPQEAPLPEPDGSSGEELLEYLAGSPDFEPRVQVRAKCDSPPAYEVFAEDCLDLQEHLISQLCLADLTDEERLAGEFIVGNIDQNGYLACSIEEIAAASGQSPVTVRRVLSEVQSFDPPGVGARDLMECLLIQAKRVSHDPTVLKIIECHLDDLAAGRFRAISKDMRVPVKDVLLAKEAVLRLDPKPGGQFSRVASYVYPEINIRLSSDGPAVQINESALPHLRWNSFYRKLLTMGNAEAKEYLQEQLRRARSLIRSIEQRKDTILRVMECVAQRQSAFFEKGPGFLQPLTLKDVALELGLHESTVSRCIKDKYVDTPYGVYPCRAFFSTKVSAAGEDVSSQAVRRLIQAMVRNEDPSAPLSDQDIVHELARQGVRVARRTIAKYRGQLGILPSSKRKC